MRKRSRSTVLMFLVALAAQAGCSSTKDDPSYANPFDPDLGQNVPIPDSLVVAVGDNAVQLSWALAPGEKADEYAVFRKRTDEPNAEDEKVLGRTTQRQYLDTGVRNGGTYFYCIAAGLGGQFGRRTEEAQALPGLFSILIANGAEFTRSDSVSVAYSCPNAAAVQLGDSLGSFTSAWRPATTTVEWNLPTGDGVKTVYARFRLSDGSQTLPVFSSITLDTQATIRSVGFTGPTLCRPGDIVLFRLDAGEKHGNATITVEGLFTALKLFDDGTNGDSLADDGIYERRISLPAGISVLDKSVQGDFTDAAGNVAGSMTGPELLSVLTPPDPVRLLGLTVSEPPDTASVTVRWTGSTEQSFSDYEIYRSEAAPVDSLSRLIGTIASASTTEWTDGDVAEGSQYFYRVYVKDTSGQEQGSNTLETTVPNLRPPRAVTVQTPTSISSTAIRLEWSRSPDRDFASYQVYRDTSGVVTDTDSLTATITSADQTYWNDRNLVENTAYYYIVYTIDRGGRKTPSNEVEATTSNEAPPPVVLNDASEIDSTAATLSWSRSDVHDFASYLLYRDAVASVTTASQKVVELDDRLAISYHDTGLTAGKRWYYRVFVSDDGSPAKSTGSNTITLVTP